MATFRVTNTNDSGTGSLRQAISDSNRAGGADRIVFDSSLTGETINLTSGQITIDDDLIIEGLGAENLTIDAGGNSRIFRTVSGFDGLLSGPGPSTDITIQGLTLTGGNTESDGGAILAQRSSITSTLNLTIVDSTLSGNSAGGRGGAIFGSDRIDESITIENSNLSGNIAGEVGGAIFADQIEIFGSTISGNSASLGGGGVFSRIFIFATGSNFTENTTDGSGGGLAGQTIVLAGNIFNNNRAEIDGGGIFTIGATLILNSEISENEAGFDGGGISVRYIPTAGVFGGPKTTLITNTTISGNKAEEDGGGIQVVGNTIQLIPIDLDQNIFGGANLVTSNVTITNNIADSNNDGLGDGGGIWNTPSGTFGDFETERFTFQPGDITLENSIIAGNFDTPGNNGIGFIAPDIDGAARGNANNLLGNIQGLTIEESVASASESLGTGSDIISANPGLEPLLNNGGTTRTHALSPDSIAINGGDNNKILRETHIDFDGNGRLQVTDFDGNPNTNNAQLPYDQRFTPFSRVVGGIVDIGAFEAQDITFGNETLATLTEANIEILSNEDLTFI